MGWKISSCSISPCAPTPRYGNKDNRMGRIFKSVQKSCKYSRMTWGFEYSQTPIRPHGLLTSGDSSCDARSLQGRRPTIGAVR